MKHSMGKRLIAVLLCLAVFAGSELTGATNLVGDLFAGTTEEPDGGAPLEYNTANISLEDPSDDADIQEGDKSPGADDQSGGQSDDEDAGQDDAGTGNEDGSVKGGEDNGQTGVEDGSQQDKENNNNNNDNNIGGDDSSDETESNDDADENQNGGDNKENNAGGENTDSKADGDEKQEDAEPSGTDGDQEEKPDVDADADNAEQAAQPALNENMFGTESDTSQESIVQEQTPAQKLMMAKALEAEEETLQGQINQALEQGDTEIILKLEEGKEYKENLVIPDEMGVTIDLNGQKLQAIREDQDSENTLNMITVYGKLTVKDDSSEQSGMITNGTVSNIRAVTVASSGSFTLESGTITGFSVSGNGAGVRVEENGHFTMSGGAIRGNRAEDGYGGGLFTYRSADVSLTAGELSGNTASYGGGAAFNLADGVLPIDPVVRIQGNTASEYGGGLYLEKGENVTLDQLTLEENTAASGGGIWFANVTNVTMSGCTLKKNTAENNGGGIGSGAEMILELSDGTFAGNQAESGSGGAVCLEARRSTLNVTGSEISGNQASVNGGGIALLGQNANANTVSTLTIRSSKITENTLTGEEDRLYGAGVMTGQYFSITIENTEISGNKGATFGGGLSVGQNSTSELMSVLIAENELRTIGESGRGGGIYKGSGGFMTLTDCKIIGNKGDTLSYGGGICGSTIELQGSTLVSKNEAYNGGGIYTDGSRREQAIVLQDGVRIAENQALGNGGGIGSSSPGGYLIMSGGQVDENQAYSGGGICIKSLEIYGGEICRNQAESGYGGGIYSSYNGVVQIQGKEGVPVRIEDNQAKNGGGLYINNLWSGNQLWEDILENVVIQGNRVAESGGGIRCSAWTNLRLNRTIISENTAQQKGGGLYIPEGYVESHLTGCEVRNNTADKEGQDIFVSGIHGVSNSSKYALRHYAYLDLPAASGMVGASSGAVWMDENRNMLLDGPVNNLEAIEERESLTYDETGEIWIGGCNSPGDMENLALTFQEKSVQTACIGDRYYSSVQEAVNALAEEGSASSEKIILLSDSREDVIVPKGMQAVLDLNGWTLQGLSASVLWIETGAKLTIQDNSVEKTGAIRGGKGTVSPYQATGSTKRYGGGLFVEGTAVLENGTITANTADYGGAVYVSAGGGFRMSGGTITGNRLGIGAVVVGHEEEAKGGSASFLMTGGEIRGNQIRGVRVSKTGTFMMEGGSIADHSGNQSGAGVYLRDFARFTMLGGEITGNCTTNLNDEATGSAVYAGYDATLELLGGEITGNQVANPRPNAAGVVYYVSGSGGSFSLGNSEDGTGTKIHDNYVGSGRRDLYFRKGVNVAYLQDASVMMGAADGQTYCWYDHDAEEELKELPSGQTDKVYILSVAKSQGAQEENPAAKIGEKKYPSLLAAVKAAQNGDTITLLRDVTESVAWTQPPKDGQKIKVTVDLAGHNLSPESSYVFSLQDTDLVLTNSDKEKGGITAGNAENARAFFLYNTSSQIKPSLTLQDVIVSGFHGAPEGGAIYAYGAADVILNNCTIRDCSSTGSGGAVSMRVRAYATKLKPVLTITKSRIEGNQAAVSGGGIYLYANYDQKVTITDTVFLGNQAETSGGGLYFYVGNEAANESEITLEKVTFEENQAEAEGGGACIARANKSLLKEVCFKGNRASSGGGLCTYNRREWNGQTTTLQGCVFESNEGRLRGGGLYTSAAASQPSQLVIQGCKFYGNTAADPANGSGGGLHSAGAILRMEPYQEQQCIVEGNQARSGAGVYISNSVTMAEDAGSVIRNSVFQENQTTVTGTGAGGGLYLLGRVSLTDCEVTGNASRSGGGLYLYRYRGTLTRVTMEGNGAFNGSALQIYTDTPCSADSKSANYFETILKDCEIKENNKIASTSAIFASARSVHLRIADTSITGHKSCGIDMRCSQAGDGATLALSGNTVISGNHAIRREGDAGYTVHGGGLRVLYTDVMLADQVRIEGNRADNGSGGGIYLNCSRLNMGDQVQIRENQARNGGAIYIYGEPDKEHPEWRKSVLNIQGGQITGNRASINGGAVYATAKDSKTEGKDPWVEVNLSKGEISGNRADSQGGGLCLAQYSAKLTLQAGAGLYDNRASFGQDIYGGYAAGYGGVRLDLAKASDMFPEGSARTGTSWLNEEDNTYTGERIYANPLRRRSGLTLISSLNEDNVAAYAGTVPMSSVQAAVDCVMKREDTDRPQEGPVITLAKDVTENVTIPAGFDGVLNLNGYRLQGYTTALDCYGEVHIRSEAPYEALKEKSVSSGSDLKLGSISGAAPEYGGGIRVRSGGYAVLESGQITECQAAVGYDDNNHGGAAVCADFGTFELTGEGVITGNTSRRGAAVYVRGGSSEFRMTGGRIEKNTATTYGVIFNNGGTVQLESGSITDNRAEDAGVIFNSKGTLRIAGSPEKPLTICRNQAAKRGGAIYQSGGTVSLSCVTIEKNEVTGALSAADTTFGAGGAVYQANGTMTIGDGVMLCQNSAVRGGAIYQAGGKLSMLGGVITRNRAKMGGGVAQYALAEGDFRMMKGKVFDNRSTMSGAGNDFYSAYEGTGSYGVEAGHKVPKLTIPAAVSMENSSYNVWKNDAYKGPNRTGTTLRDGQYITAGIPGANDLQLTADRYRVDIVSDLSSDMKVVSFGVDSAKTEDGTVGWDQSKDKEKTAGSLAKVSGSGYTLLNDKKYTDEQGMQRPYVQGSNGTLYEQEQMAEWSPGDDSGPGNALVRTFDKVTYALSGSIALAGEKQPADPSDPDASDNLEEDTRERTVRLWIKAKLPCGEEKAAFAFDGGDPMDAYIQESVTEDKTGAQYLTGYWEMKVKPGATFTKFIPIQIKGAKNSDTIKPEFEAWIEGNKENEEQHTKCAARTLTVSATPASRYNVALDYNPELSYTGYFDLNTGEESSADTAAEGGSVVYGTMVGYGITLELYNNDPAKKLKGIEIDSDSAQFDLDLKGTLYFEGKEVSKAAPYIWAYKENEKSDRGMPLEGTSSRMNMNWNDEDDLEKTTSYAYHAAPFNSGGDVKSCYSGGSWSMEGSQPEKGKESTHVTVKVSGYSIDFDSNNPTQTSDGKTSDVLNANYVKAFSAGYVQVLFPWNKSVAEGNTGSLSVGMEAAVSGFQSRPGQPDKSSHRDDDLQSLAEYYGYSSLEEFKKTDYAVNEQTYRDNRSAAEMNIFVVEGKGNSDTLWKYNYFQTGDRKYIPADRTKGNGNTPLNSEVYIGGLVSFSSKSVNTKDPDDPHYDPDTQTAPQERNYLTAVNILQKFDARAYTPVGTSEPIVDRPYTFDSKDPAVSPAFEFATTETLTDQYGSGTRSFDLTILYAAKPDGANWEIKPLGDGSGKDDGGAPDMDQYREENLLYFKTMADLKAYFQAQGKDGQCVAVLYELRNTCIRDKREVHALCRMKVTDDFGCTGNTFCTTNDVRGWTTYRPLYKEKYQSGDLKEILYRFSWLDCAYGDSETAYGAALEKGTVYEDRVEKGEESDKTVVDSATPGYKEYFGFAQEKGETADQRMFTSKYFDGYIKTQYKSGSQAPGTHTGWEKGNSLLLYTLDTSIVLATSDKIPGSNGQKDTYDVAKGERIVNFQVTPKIFVSSAVENHPLVINGTQATAITIELELPKNLTYQPGSVLFDYSGEECGYDSMDWDIQVDGQKVILKTAVTDIGKGLPRIRYTCRIDQNVKKGDIRSTATIHAEYEEVRQLAAESHVSYSTIHIIETAANGIWLDVGDMLVEVGEDLEYTLNFINNMGDKSTSDIEICDVLPYVGDGRGTAFTGGYWVKEVSVEFEKQEDYAQYIAQSNPSSMLKYKDGGMTVPLTEEQQKQMISGFQTDDTTVPYSRNDTEKTVTFRMPADEKALIQNADTESGIALYAKMPKVNKGFKIRVKLSPRKPDTSSGEASLLESQDGTQKGTDLYENGFFFQSGSSVAPSNEGHIQAVGRTVSGTVWMDQNHDGRMAVDEKRLSGIKVSLWKKAKDASSWERAVDVIGREIADQTTGEDGSYTFRDLPGGMDTEYTVKFEDSQAGYLPAQEASRPLPFGQLSVTAPDSFNRAAAHYSAKKQENGLETLEYAQLASSILLPPKANIQSGQYSRTNLNCGLYYVNLSLAKEWQNILTPAADGTGVKLNVIGTQGEQNVNTTEYVLTQERGKVSVQAGGAASVDAEVQEYGKPEGAAAGKTPYRCIWTVKDLALQAEGKVGAVTYTCEETGAFDKDGNSLSGYARSIRKTGSENSGTVVLTAENRQHLYDLRVTKQKAGETNVQLSGAAFAVYEDEACRKPVREADSQDAVVTSLNNLLPGTWYLKETKAPDGYALNAAVFKVVITATDNPDGRVSAGAEVFQITDEVTGAVLPEAKALTSTKTDSVNGANVSFAFSVEDQVLYSLPSTGGNGTTPYRIAGLMLLLISAGFFEYYRRRRRRGEVA